MNKYSVNLFGILGVALVIAFASFMLSRSMSRNRTDVPRDVESVAVCTMEAKICPDGSSVGRKGPQCEFESCPTEAPTAITVPADDASWHMFESADVGVMFRYPNDLGTKYMRATEWPPKVTAEKGRFTCFETSDGLYGMTTKRIVNGMQYCVTVKSEGAAGSTYTTYTYMTEREGVRITVMFTIQASQCLNYDQPEQTECITERDQFSVDALVAKMVATVALSPGVRMK